MIYTILMKIKKMPIRGYINTAIPFCTSGSSSISNSMNTLKNYNKEINWVEGKRLTNNKKVY